MSWLIECLLECGKFHVTILGAGSSSRGCRAWLPINIASSSAESVGWAITSSCSTSLARRGTEGCLVGGLTLGSTDLLGLLEEVIEAIADYVETVSILFKGIVLVICCGTSQSVVSFEISIDLLILVLVTLLSRMVWEHIICLLKTRSYAQSSSVDTFTFLSTSAV